jgi:methyl-accepting chemotaxis protein
VNLLTNHESFALFLEDVILDTIRSFNEGMLNEYLLMPFYGLKWAQIRLNENHPDCIYPKLNEKWFAQALEDIKNDAIRNFIYRNYKKPENVVFLEGEVIGELFDEKGNLKISEYERKVYQLLERQYRVERGSLEEEINKAFVYGALYKLKQANLTPYQFIIEKLMIMKNLVKIVSDFVSGREHTFIMIRNISEEKRSISELINRIRKKLRQEEKISFDGDEFIFKNEKYIQEIIDSLELIEDYVNSIQDSSDLLKRAILLTQLYCIERSLETLHKTPLNDFSEVISRIRRNLDDFDRSKKELFRHLEKISMDFLPKSVILVGEKIKKYLSKISILINEGRLMDLVKKELDDFEKVIGTFCEESEEVISIIVNGEIKVNENNERVKSLKGKKEKAKKILNYVEKYGLKEYFMLDKIPEAEKDFFETLSSFAKQIVSLEEIDEIDPKIIKCLVGELREIEFNQFIEKYREIVQSKLEKINQSFETYYSGSTEFLNKTETFVAFLENFWSRRAKHLGRYVNLIGESREEREGISRALKLIEFYHGIITDIGISGVKIAHAIAFGILDSFLFLDMIQIYAEKTGVSLEDFSYGLEMLKKNGVLREGVG